MSVLGIVKCFVRNVHDPVRHPLGGFRCRVCNVSGADMEAFGFVDGGYVSPVRRVLDVDRKASGKTTEWDTARRGGW